MSGGATTRTLWGKKWARRVDARAEAVPPGAGRMFTAGRQSLLDGSSGHARENRLVKVPGVVFSQFANPRARARGEGIRRETRYRAGIHFRHRPHFAESRR
jgi:hypothetical protein